MAALGFMVFMAVMFIIGLGFAITGLALLLINRVLKKKGSGKKPLKVVGIIILTLGVIGVVIPSAFLGMIRMGNGSVDSDYVETNTMLVWEGESFTYENEKYVPLNIWREFEPFDFVMDSPKEKKTPVFNIKNKGTFLISLFNAYDKTTVYEVENDCGATIFDTSNGVYCKETEWNQVAAYYMNEENYTWSVSTFAGEKEKKRSLSLEEDERHALAALEPGTEYMPYDSAEEGGDEGLLVMDSKDELARATLYIVRLDDGWYWESDEDAETEDSEDYSIKCYKLPDSLTRKIDALY